MTGVLDGIEVLDLSEGIGGPMTGMLLADHGARVTKIGEQLEDCRLRDVCHARR